MKLNKLIILVTLFFVAGIAIYARPSAATLHHDETWLNNQVPMTIADYHLAPNGLYKMDKKTYEVLNPYGIVSRIMTNGQYSFDSVFIASDNSESFHNPLQCFASQYNDILGNNLAYVDTKAFGKVPVTLLTIKNDHIQQIILAAYCYIGPDGISAYPDSLHFSLFKKELLTGQIQQGGFYRVISQDPGSDDASKARVLKFLGNYIDAIHNQDPKDF